MPDEPDPPRKNYGFKDREFKRDNAAKPDEPPLPTAKELAIMAGPVAKHGQAAVGKARPADPNDVYGVLQTNRTVEQKQGVDEMEIRKVKSRRKRDYWLLLIASEGTLLTVAYLGRGNIFVLACSVAAMVAVAAGLTWIMWQVMNKY